VAQKGSAITNTLQFKISVWVSLMLFLLGIILIGFSTFIVRNISQEAAADNAIAMTRAEVNQIDADLESALSVASSFSNTLSAVKETGVEIRLTRHQVDSMVRQVMTKYPDLVRVTTIWEADAFDASDKAYAGSEGHDSTGRFMVSYYRNPDGTVVRVIPEEYDEAPYYICPKQIKKECVTDPSMASLDGKRFVRTIISVPVLANENTFYGIVAVEVELSDLQQHFDQTDIYDNSGVLTLISRSGMIIASSDHPEMMGGDISQWQDDYKEDMEIVLAGVQSSKEDDGFLEIYSPLYIGSNKAPWSLQLLIPLAEISKQANQLTLQLVAIALGMIVVSIAIMWFTVGRVAAHPIRKLSEVITRLSRGDTLRDIKNLQKEARSDRSDEIGQIGRSVIRMVEYIREKEEVAVCIAANDLTVEATAESAQDELGNAFITMVNNLRSSINRVADSARQVEQEARGLDRAASEAGQAAGEIASTISEVASGTGQQAAAVNHTAGVVDAISHSIQNVADGARAQSVAVERAFEQTRDMENAIQVMTHSVNQVQQNSRQATESAQRSASTMQSALDGMNRIKEKVDISAMRVEEMGESSRQISDILEMIEDIASQTNLLALNAAIEAARAGEHGKGFAVVAGEVRKLAERSANAAREISGLVRRIQYTVSEAVSAMKEGSNEVEAGVHNSIEARKALDEILTAIEGVRQQVENAGQAATRMQHSSQGLATSMGGVTDVVSANNRAVEEITGGATQLTELIENIASVSEENSASVQEVSASTEEVSAQVQEVSDTVKILARMAQELNDVVRSFRLKDDADLETITESAETIGLAYQ